MPVENIHRDGSLMFNKSNEGGIISGCVTSFPGSIHDDDEFNADDLKKIKDKDSSMSKHWRYLSDDEAEKKKEQRAEQEAQDAADEAARLGLPLAEGAFEDSTGTEAKKSAADREAEERKEKMDKTPPGRTTPANPVKVAKPKADNSDKTDKSDGE